MAYEAVNKNWIGDGIWNNKWGELQGLTWIHEDLAREEQEAEQDRNVASAEADDENPPGDQTAGAIGEDSLPQTHNPNTYNIFDPASLAAYVRRAGRETGRRMALDGQPQEAQENT